MQLKHVRMLCRIPWQDVMSPFHCSWPFPTKGRTGLLACATSSTCPASPALSCPWMFFCEGHMCNFRVQLTQKQLLETGPKKLLVYNAIKTGQSPQTPERRAVLEAQRPTPLPYIAASKLAPARRSHRLIPTPTVHPRLRRWRCLRGWENTNE